MTGSPVPTTNVEDMGRRNGAIDRLRGLAILLVVVHHIGLRIPLKDGFLAGFVPRQFLNALIYNGYEAVFVFFVVSGFLIASHARSRWGALPQIDLRAFYARRFARIAPCLVLVVAVLSALHLLGAPDYVINRPGQSLGRAVVAALGVHLNWYEGVTGYLPGGWDVLWSLSIEEVFYFGFPIFCRLLRREWAIAITLIPVALSLPVSLAALEGNEIWQEKAYLPGIAAIATGVLAALAKSHFERLSQFWIRAVAVFGMGGLASILFFEDFLWKLVGNSTMLVLTFSTAMLVLVLAVKPSPPPRSTAAVRAWGRLTYEIYLAHMFVVLGAVALFRASGVDARYGVLVYLPALALAWALGAIVARTFSLPCERALRRRLLARA